MDRTCERSFIENGNKKETNFPRKFLGRIMRKEGMENPILTEQIQSKRDRGKQHITYLTCLCKCLAEQGLGEINK